VARWEGLSPFALPLSPSLPLSLSLSLPLSLSLSLSLPLPLSLSLSLPLSLPLPLPLHLPLCLWYRCGHGRSRCGESEAASKTTVRARVGPPYERRLPETVPVSDASGGLAALPAAGTNPWPQRPTHPRRHHPVRPSAGPRRSKKTRAAARENGGDPNGI
jgi:hypothetical protein